MNYVILYDYRLLVIDQQGDFALPTVQDLAHLALDKLSIIYQSDQHYVATIVDTSINYEIANLKFISIKQALNYFDSDLINQLLYYHQLNSYYSNTKFCGSCSKPVIRQLKNKFVKCLSCDKELYPQICPCVIVRIHKDNQILMARSPHFPPGSWGLIAGFVELGESLDQAVAREVMEEVGIKIKNIQYWGSQPWAFPTPTLMVGFIAEYESGELVLEEQEIEAAGWYSKDNIPGIPSSNYSISSRMINEYLNT